MTSISIKVAHRLPEEFDINECIMEYSAMSEEREESVDCPEKRAEYDNKYSMLSDSEFYELRMRFLKRNPLNIDIKEAEDLLAEMIIRTDKLRDSVEKLTEIRKRYKWSE